MRLPSARCCRIWLAQATSRAILIVCMVDVFITKREPRKRAEMLAAIVVSRRGKARLRAWPRESMLTALGSTGRAGGYNFHNYRLPNYQARRGLGAYRRRGGFVAHHASIVAIF